MKTRFHRPLAWVLALLAAAGLCSSAAAAAAAAPVQEVGLRILNSDIVRVVYPYDLAMAGADATVEVSYVVDTTGAPIGAVVEKTSNPDAAGAFLGALDEMLFATAKSGGETVVSGRQTLSVSIRGVQKPSDLAFIDLLKKPGTVVSGVREIDGTLKPLGPVPPAIFPSSLLNGAVKEGTATLEFYIDQTGTVQLPKVLAATHPAMGWSAASAILTWKFAPPLRGGAPAIVKVSGLPIPFKAPVEPAAAGSISPGVRSGSGLKAEIRVEAPEIINGQVKLNTTIVGTVPLTVLVDVAEDGTMERYAEITIRNPNINNNPDGRDDFNKVALKSGEPPPARIVFNRLDYQVSGTAKIKR